MQSSTLVAEAVAAGYGAILIERTAYENAGASLIAELKAILGSQAVLAQDDLRVLVSLPH
jgi:hypothetical protein